MQCLRDLIGLTLAGFFFLVEAASALGDCKCVSGFSLLQISVAEIPLSHLQIHAGRQLINGNR